MASCCVKGLIACVGYSTCTRSIQGLMNANVQVGDICNYALHGGDETLSRRPRRHQALSEEGLLTM
jgi:hypothetical protein